MISMSKSKVSIILYSFIGCLLVTIIVLVIALSNRPKIMKEDLASTEKPKTETPVDNNSDAVKPEDTDDPDNTPDITEPEDTTPEDTEKVTKQYVEVSQASTNVKIRTEANTTCTSLGLLTSGMRLEYIGVYDNDWITVKYNDTTAYVSSAFVQVVEVEE